MSPVLTTRFLLLLSGLFACTEYTPQSTKPSAAGDSGGATGDTGAPIEVCNGVDDDGDGEVDEDAGDLDADGVADCLDTNCDLPAADTGWGPPEHECGAVGAPATSPWAVEPMWSMSSELGCFNARVLDLDADGSAEIICVDQYVGKLQVIRGDDGTLLWSERLLAPGSGLAVADVNGDGTVEIVGFSRTGALVAYDPAGALVWAGDTNLAEDGLEANPITVRDIDANGIPEVLTRKGIVSGTDGSLLAAIEPTFVPYRDWEAELAVGDLDQNGVVDMASGWESRSVDGADRRADTMLDGWDGTITPLLVQADADPEAEVVWFGNTGFLVVDDSGATLSSTVSTSLLTYSLPCAGDIDGDGETELVTAGLGVTVAFDLDGTVLWTTPSADDTGSYVACTVFDFDGDGAKEVVVGDQGSMYVLDGRTGATLYEDDSRYSNTFGDVAIVADLDGDGSVEILMSNPYGAGYDGYPLRAWRNQNRDWPPGTSTWPVSNWSGTGLLGDGSVERTPEEPWLATGIWRGQPEWPALGADLVPTVDGACASACEAPGRVRLRAHLVNLGPSDSRPGAPLAVYGIAEDGTQELLEVFATDGWLAPGERSEAWEIETTVGQAAAGLRLVAGDAGTGGIVPSDCAPANNSTDWLIEGCD